MARKQTQKQTVSKLELAAMLEVTPRWVEALCQRGMPREKNGSFDIEAALGWYARFLRAAIQRQEGSADVAVGLSRDRLRLAKAQTQRIQFEVEKLQKELVSPAALEELDAKLAEQVRRHFSDFAERVTPLLVGKTRAEIVKIVEREIRAELTALSQGLSRKQETPQ